jgi:hypothetical protein
VSPCEREHTRLSTSPSKSRAHRGSATHLKLEKPRFIFLEGSGGTAVVPAGATVALTGASAALAGSSTDDPAAGASAPATGACSTARGDGGRGFHFSGGGPSLSTSSSFDNEFAGVPGGESPCCSPSRYSSLCCSRRSHLLILLSFARAARSCSRRCEAWVATRAQAVGGSDRAASMVTLY